MLRTLGSGIVLLAGILLAVEGLAAGMEMETAFHRRWTEPVGELVQ